MNIYFWGHEHTFRAKRSSPQIFLPIEIAIFLKTLFCQFNFFSGINRVKIVLDVSFYYQEKLKSKILWTFTFGGMNIPFGQNAVSPRFFTLYAHEISDALTSMHMN